MTTGTFTPAAVKEATRDGAPPIDLLDGIEIANKLRELKLGIRVETTPHSLREPFVYDAERIKPTATLNFVRP